jgi:hypothetical protein
MECLLGVTQLCDGGEIIKNQKYEKERGEGPEKVEDHHLLTFSSSRLFIFFFCLHHSIAVVGGVR